MVVVTRVGQVRLCRETRATKNPQMERCLPGEKRPQHPESTFTWKKKRNRSRSLRKLTCVRVSSDEPGKANGETCPGAVSH